MPEDLTVRGRDLWSLGEGCKGREKNVYNMGVNFMSIATHS